MPAWRRGGPRSRRRDTGARATLGARPKLIRRRPWKYGFEAIEPAVRLTFTDARPVSFREEIQGSEYGFRANVNPEVPHPRWRQAKETPLAGREKVPPLLFNGYAEFVADLYVGMENEPLFM